MPNPAVEAERRQTVGHLVVHPVAVAEQIRERQTDQAQGEEVLHGQILVGAHSCLQVLEVE